MLVLCSCLPRCVAAALLVSTPVEAFKHYARQMIWIALLFVPASQFALGLVLLVVLHSAAAAIVCFVTGAMGLVRTHTAAHTQRRELTVSVPAILMSCAVCLLSLIHI